LLLLSPGTLWHYCDHQIAHVCFSATTFNNSNHGWLLYGESEKGETTEIASPLTAL
jgi:hypothetical protein